MKKLMLALESLEVESFQTTAPEAPRGTVFGEQCTCHTACTCPGCPTCDGTCPDTCANSCAATCGNTCWDSCGCYSGEFTCRPIQCGPTIQEP